LSSTLRRPLLLCLCTRSLRQRLLQSTLLLHLKALLLRLDIESGPCLLLLEPETGAPSEALRALRGHQRHSEAIGGHWRPSEAIRGDERHSEAIKAHQKPSDVLLEVERLRERPEQELGILPNRADLPIILIVPDEGGHQRSSEVIRGHQTSSSSSYPSLPKVEDPPGEWVGALDERSPDLPSASRRKYGFNKGKSIHAEMRGIEWDADTMQPEP